MGDPLEKGETLEGEGEGEFVLNAMREKVEEEERESEVKKGKNLLRVVVVLNPLLLTESINMSFLLPFTAV